MLVVEPLPESPPARPSSLITYREQYECLRCESVIPLDLVKRHEPTRQDMLQGIRRISVHCPACRTGFTGAFRLSGGILQPAGAVELVSNADDLADVIERYEHVRGDRIVMPAERPEAIAQQSAADAPAADDSCPAGQTSYLEQQRTIDREFDQRVRFAEDEPGRDFND